MKKYQFKDVEFMTAKEKQLVLTDWIHFLKHLNTDNCKKYIDNFGNSMPKLFKYFTERLYKHLTLHCSFIAHYDRYGFFITYFNEPERTQLFLRQFTDGKSIEYGNNWWLDGDYADINQAMCKVAKDIIKAITDKKAIEQKEIDIKKAKQLLQKHGLELKYNEIS